MAFPVFTLVACILLIILIITATLAIIYFIRRQEAYSYVSPWCYADYRCAGNTTYNPVDAFNQVITNCQPVNGQPSALCACAWSEFYAPTSGINTCTT